MSDFHLPSFLLGVSGTTAVVLVALFASGVAGGKSPAGGGCYTDADGVDWCVEPVEQPSDYSDFLVFDSGTNVFWSEPECPEYEGYGPLTIKMPPGFSYETVEIECGRVEEVPIR